VHDAARPCLNESDLSKLIEECLKACAKEQDISGAILASPVADTIKKSYSSQPSKNPNFLIDSTVDRSQLWHAQTPQMFRINELANAIESGLAMDKTLTDEASAIEYTGKKVLLVEGATSNLKITRPGDLPLALFYLSNHQKTKLP
jgi:2-C-methyl-D-erythritol 4-phosphate cytidylyltransferase